MLVCNDVDRAEKTIEKLESLKCNSDVILVLKSLKLLKSEEDPKAAVASLSNNLKLTDPILLLDAGTIFLRSNNIDVAIIHFLRAAKIDNCNSEIFYCLGKAYNALNDEERCLKCLEKCIQLNFQNSEAVQLLSSLYRKRQNWSSNTMLLENAVKFSHGTSGKWAYFQLGLHYLAQRRYDDAVNAFRSALRFKSPDKMFYVGLGDAYFARGSYKSALNVYEKALEARIEGAGDQSYICLQIACINRTLQKFDEALVGFKELLQENPTYIPALKGIAETHYKLAVHLKQQQRHARARMNAQESINYLLNLIQLRCDFACVWRLLASVLDLTYKLSVQNRFLKVPGEFIGESESFVTIRDDTLMQLAARCLSKAIKVSQDDQILWRELSNNYLSRAVSNVVDTKSEEKQQFFVYAQQAAKQAIKLEPKNWENWNLLGVICVLQPEKTLALAQHCFIQALNIEKRSGVAWSNLGLLYFSQGNIKLANRAFGKSQQSNEKLINAWVGQALIAEDVGETEEAIDLFRHCTELGFNKQSALGYANRVCSILDESPRLDNILPKYRYVINKMNAIALAIDQINWYNGYVEVQAGSSKTNVDSLCFLAHLCVAKKLYKNAIKAYKDALILPDLDQSQRNKIMCDLAYVYLKVGNFKMAIEAFKSVKEADLKSTIGLALAHSKANDHETAYSIYGSALEWIASNDLQKSSILTAMSAILYLFQGETDAKTLLFQSLCEKNLQTLLSACALGLLHDDMQLAELTISQMKEFENDPLVGHHVVFLITQYILHQKKMKQAINYASAMIHRYPDRPELRRVLSNVLIHYKKPRYEIAAARLALSTVTLDISSSQVTCDSNAAAKSLALASKSMSRVDARKAKILAQKAIYMNPVCKEAWAAFITV